MSRNISDTDCVVLDQGGEALFTYSDMADDVVALMDHFVVSKAHIAGASMGGQITTLVGVRHPARYSFSTFFNVYRKPFCRDFLVLLCCSVYGESTCTNDDNALRCLSLTVIMSASPLMGTVAVAMARNPQWFAAVSTKAIARFLDDCL